MGYRGCHTVVAAIEINVAMAHSGIVDWIDGFHDEKITEKERLAAMADQ